MLNDEDPVSREYGAPHGAQLVRYRRTAPLPGGVGTDDGWIVASGVERLGAAGGGTATTGPGGRVMPLGDIALPGAHNVSNVLAAVAAGLLLGVAPDAIRRAVAGFRGVEHRLEPVALVDGVLFVNDSQGTQPDAVIAALRSFEQPLVLIAGGRGKGLAMDELAGVVAERASAAVLIGESAPDLAEAFGAAGLARIEPASSLEEAVALADALARRLLADDPSRPGDRAAQPGRRQLRHVRRLRRPRPRLQGRRRRARRGTHRSVTRPSRRVRAMTDSLRARRIVMPQPPGTGRVSRSSTAMPATLPQSVRRNRRTQAASATTATPPAATRTLAPGRVVRGPQRERHEPDYLILVSIVALAAVGILMIYSSSGLRAGARGRTATCGAPSRRRSRGARPAW